ncbi:ssDNA-binding protein, mitochondrial [Diatrype stigma]|uniref:SsDNA-binding protein, mitochondrial n=1 Tax=Diatrype stigma TaxID=117547 RepID=A0AAN9UQZ2_9PEZI
MSFLARRATAAAPRLLAGAATRPFSASAPRDIAKITLVGNLAATPEVKATPSGKEVIEYAVASNEGSGDKQKTSWFRVSAFVDNDLRRDFLTSLPKGSTVYVEGDASIRIYPDPDHEGKQKSALNIYQRNLQVLRRPSAPASEGRDHE